MGMLRRVVIGRRIATERGAARLARPQMDPGSADLDALLTLPAPRTLDLFDRRNVGT